MRAYPGLDPLTSAPSNLRKFDVFAIDTLRLVETTAAVNGSPTVFGKTPLISTILLSACIPWLYWLTSNTLPLFSAEGIVGVPLTSVPAKATTEDPFQ